MNWSADQAGRRLLNHLAAEAASVSERQLRGCWPRLDAAGGPVEEAVQVIRSQLGLPASDTS